MRLERPANAARKVVTAQRRGENNVKRLRLVITLVAMGLVLGACATKVTRGKEFNVSAIDSLQPGVTTYSEAVAMRGKPTSEQDDGNVRRVSWVYATVRGNRLHH